MLFNSLDFAIFLPIVFILYWFVVQKNLKLQNALIVSIDKSEILQIELSSELLEYFEKIKYLDKSNFSDGTHLINPKNYNSIINHD